MNTRKVLDDSVSPHSLSVQFNADYSYFAVGLESGFRIFDAEKCEASRSRRGGIGAAEMRDRSDCVALVGGGRQPKFPHNKVVLWNDSKELVSLKLEFRTPVQRVRLSHSHIVVVLLNTVNLYNFALPPDKIAEFETANNPFGLCCLGAHLFAFPGRTHGQVQIVQLSTRNVSIIPAHTTPLRTLALSSDGELLATASENGTLIRVWSTSNCSKIAELRRGVDPAAVFSVAFSPSSNHLAVTSDKSTLHIFDIPTVSQNSRQGTPRGRGQSPNPYNKSPTARDPLASPETTDSNKTQKWGVLGKLPLLPRLFSDTYSFASAHFEMGDQPVVWQAGRSVAFDAPIPGVPGGRPPMGVVGWIDEETLVVVSAGNNARWERFRLGVTEDGTRLCYRDGWKRYME